ncbi:hypothetical protein G4V62_03090 [Bacillaceae bacterium SIJ1]|uniref:hypothetical protein n=1 Tax=Litoribacterium kuwaitense TaxID=1398745 RepID=UPI0013EADA3D|nr:hypothetical protein [Litoribacterium kuwaitense]NGP43984.1 hypothetical protein [Litoribacterium kuwaitense]
MTIERIALVIDRAPEQLQGIDVVAPLVEMYSAHLTLLYVASEKRKHSTAFQGMSHLLTVAANKQVSDEKMLLIQQKRVEVEGEDVYRSARIKLWKNGIQAHFKAICGDFPYAVSDFAIQENIDLVALHKASSASSLWPLRRKKMRIDYLTFVQDLS